LELSLEEGLENFWDSGPFMAWRPFPYLFQQ
jgi:hypothetical protein